MVARKKSNLRTVQDANEARRLKLINAALVKLHNEKATYPDVTALAKRVAEMVTLQETLEGTKRPGISYTTLLRKASDGNPGPYRLQLEMFRAGRFDPKNINRQLTVKEIEAFITANPALRAYIAHKDLEISNLKVTLEDRSRDLKRLTKHLSSLGKDANQITEDAGKGDRDAVSQAKRDHAMTVTWIVRLLKQPELEFIGIDEENEVIRTKTRRGAPPIVADTSIFKPFFRALKMLRAGEGQHVD